MKEIEIKFKVENLEGPRKIIKKLGARLLWKGIEENYYFDTLDKKLKKRGQVLRIKKWKGFETTLTLKTDLEGYNRKRFNIREEARMLIDESHVKFAARILKHLGFVEFFRYNKYREHWEAGNVSFELDKVGSRFFVEIEAPKKKIRELADKLGLDWAGSTAESYIELIK
ncbi:class IV adenylate cyclase [Candidatus Wolfebacteria bacterium]|nr:class IV adenylate cyclase [Candidatus Wolfebacteria bacterium]